MRKSLDFLRPSYMYSLVGVHLSTSSKYYVYLPFSIPYKTNKQSSHFQNGDKKRQETLLRCKFISAALNLGKSVAGNNQDVKEIYWKYIGCACNLDWRMMHSSFRIDNDAFLLRSGNSLSSVSSNRKFRKVVLTVPVH